ncbi:MAG: GAF domain-containing protein [Deltaproteobacteria bacterium]|nr:GAF domain-containing protein [Deltaproteobacteria bacterium]
MPIRNRFRRLSIKNRGLHYKLYLAFGSFFLFPIFGFLIFAVKYDMLTDENIAVFFLGVLAFSLLGFVLIRGIVDQVTTISKSFSASVQESGAREDIAVVGSTDELRDIVSSFETLNTLLKENVTKLDRESAKLSTLKELSNLCYITLDMDELFYITLERALAMVQAEAGSVLILERPRRDKFIVQTTIGREGKVRQGDRVNFETSIAKFAVINKSPLLVEDIERDKRFGKKTRSNYDTKSFICMPLKTINDIVGVLTVTNKTDGEIFTQEDVDALTPLISNATLSYNNLSLLKKNERLEKLRRSFDRASRMINSTLRGDELFHSLLMEIKENVSFTIALTLMKNDFPKDDVVVFDVLTTVPCSITIGTHLACAGSIVDSLFRQETRIIISDTEPLSHELETRLFKEQGIRSVLLSPLKIHGIIAGVLALGSSEPHAFTYREGEMISCMVEQYSAGIEKDKLNASVVKRNREMDTLNQIGNFLAASTFDITRVLEYTMDMIGVMMKVEAGSLSLLEKNEIVFQVALNRDITVLKKHRLKMGQGIIGYAAARGEPVVVRDVKHSPHFFSDIDNETGFETKSSLCVPMISQGRVIGVIEVVNKIGGEFDESDVHLLQSIASSVSIAFENARLYKKTLAMAKQERDIRKMFQKFVPKEVIERIVQEEQGAKMWQGELKTLTILNIDIRGFSSFSKAIGPQKTVSILNYFFSTTGNIIFQHSGIVDKYLGDGFLALFGAARSSIADADNAIAAALDIKQSMEVINEYLEREMGKSLAMGISINTGETVIGNIGFEQKMDYTVIGDAVNTVFRIQEVAKTVPNSIMVSENTLRATQSQPLVREVGDFEVDSSTERIRIYEIVGKRTESSPTDCRKMETS